MADAYNRFTRPGFISSAVDPTSTDDSSKGHQVGSIWLNVTGNKAWICMAQTVGAATWLQIG